MRVHFQYIRTDEERGQAMYRVTAMIELPEGMEPTEFNVVSELANGKARVVEHSCECIRYDCEETVEKGRPRERSFKKLGTEDAPLGPTPDERRQALIQDIQGAPDGR